MSTINDRAWIHRLAPSKALWHEPSTVVSKIPETLTRKTHNFFSGEEKTRCYRGAGGYLPSGERKWVGLHEDRHMQHPERIRYEREEEWTADFKAKNKPFGFKKDGSRGFSNSDHPELKLDGYCYSPWNLHRAGEKPRFVRAILPEFPDWRGPRGYYGYYHEELDAVRDGNRYSFRREPCVLYNDEDLLKFEYHRNNVGFPQVKPTEWAGVKPPKTA